MTLFGEDPSESPRLPSPWLSRSSGGTPSPLSLPTPDDSTPTTPTDSTSGTNFTRRPSSIDGFDLLDGFANEFDTTLALRDKGKGAAFIPPRQAPTLEEITVVESRTGGLQPEVDHKGHIEYKLKLLTPTSLHRLEKLRTQLKWRLVEGGGTAVYELGILDNGTLVGLNESDMAESLRTLGQMLAGLGGGAVQVTRVVRLGGSGSTRRTPSPPGTAESACTALFPSFNVPFDTDDIAFVTSVAPPQIDAQTGAVSIFPPERVRGPTPFPSNRTPDEQAELRRAKREARRLRKEAEVEAAMRAGVPLHQHQHPHSQQQQRSFQTAYPTRIAPRDKPNKPPKPPRRHRVDNPSRRARNAALGGDGEDGDHLDARPRTVPRTQSRSTTLPAAPAPKSPPVPVDQSQYKPALLQDGDAEVRYVVEAVVRKAELVPPSPPLYESHGAVRARRKSSASRPKRTEKDEFELALDVLAVGEDGVEQEGSERESGEDEDEETSETSPVEGDEGWSFLEFDLERLSTSVKAAAAAAAASAAAAATTLPGPP
ncbi:uncharacterized protein JCM10292_007383 [Rhodotorula paludigena]|uniref:uncharacterized protein n=1 Tax=Rhodotorula paludigena TaxID=86838 RepID=UPI0031782948